MLVKNIILMENETVMDALKSLNKDLSNSAIFVDTSCKYRIRNKSFEEIKDNNYFKLKFDVSNPLHRTEIAMYKVNGQSWFDIDAIYSRELVYVKPKSAQNVIYITESRNNKNLYTRLNVPSQVNPLDFIISLGDKSKDKTFILPEYIVFKIIVDNCGKKSVISKKDTIEISWDNSNFCFLQKQKNSNDFVLIGLSIDGFKLNKINGDFVYLI